MTHAGRVPAAEQTHTHTPGSPYPASIPLTAHSHTPRRPGFLRGSEARGKDRSKRFETCCNASPESKHHVGVARSRTNRWGVGGSADALHPAATGIHWMGVMSRSAAGGRSGGRPPAPVVIMARSESSVGGRRRKP